MKEYRNDEVVKSIFKSITVGKWESAKAEENFKMSEGLLQTPESHWEITGRAALEQSGFISCPLWLQYCVFKLNMVMVMFLIKDGGATDNWVV